MCHPFNPLCGIYYNMVAIRMFPRRCKRWLTQRVSWWGLLYHTLCYNYFTTWMIMFETAMEPMFWIVDRFAKYLGPIFVTLVVVMTTSVVTIFYVCLLPHVYSASLGWTVFHLIFGHWLLVNIVFHYTMGVFTHPGTPPAQNVPEIVSICKKCVSPKPPRTHHCTVCGKCILKMDHHCPWLNNCVGHFNHRYFFMFCVYMWIGTVYVSWVGHDLFKQHFYGDQPTPFPAVFYPLNAIYDVIYNQDPYDKNKAQRLIMNSDIYQDANYEEYYYHIAVLYEFILCSGVTLALTLLIIWHVKMISSGETNIEVHINKRQRAKFKKKNLVYRNPYYYGLKKNWQVFLGLTPGRSFWRHILLPSTHLPEGNGLTWARASYKYNSTNGLELL